MARDLDIITREWRARGLECDTISLGRYELVDEEITLEDRTYLVIEGEIEIDLGDDIVHPACGQEIIVPAGTLHALKSLGGPARILSGQGPASLH